MSQLDLTSAAAAEHVRDLHATADHGRLVALAACCASVWERGLERLSTAARSTVEWLRRDQLSRVDNYCATC